MFTDSNCPPLLMALIKVLRIPEATEIIFSHLSTHYSAEDLQNIFFLKVLQEEAGVENLKPQPYFRHSPIDLSQDTFRLCNLLPANFDDPILCELIDEPIELAENSYEALSYTWGKPTQARWIRLNSKPFHVQPNLFVALKSIRRTDKPSLLWVDAICINQLDDVEKGHQVSRMGQIYAKARAVAAWLGPATEDSKFAFRCLKLERLSRDIRERVQGLPGSDRIIANLPHIEPPGDGLRALCRRDYWQRAWIRQEILLAKDIYLYCGGLSVRWDEFGVKGMAANIADIEDIPESRFVGDFFFHRTKLNDEKPKTLESLLRKYGMSKCSDLRDRVFALLSLSSDCIGFEKQLVDYTIERPMLFFAVLAHCAPADPSTLASQMQDILQVRRHDLTRLWYQIGDLSAGYYDPSDSHLKTIAMNYVRQVHDYGNSGDFCHGLRLSTAEADRPTPFDTRTRESQFVGQSHQLLPDALKGNLGIFTSEDLKYFAIEDYDLGLMFRPTLFGYVYECCALKRSGGCQPIKANLEFFQDSTLRRMLALIREEDDEVAWDGSWIRTMIGLKSGEKRLPDVESLCSLLDRLSQNRVLCLIECRFIVTGIFGHAIFEPRQISGISEDQTGALEVN